MFWFLIQFRARLEAPRGRLRPPGSPLNEATATNPGRTSNLPGFRFLGQQKGRPEGRPFCFRMIDQTTCQSGREIQLSQISRAPDDPVTCVGLRILCGYS
jgi:hypothetical protein